MSWWHPNKFQTKIPILEKRMIIMKTLRRYFDDRNFWEVDTPALQTMPTADTHIHAFKTTRQAPDLSRKSEMHLHTSPELAMKKLLVAGAEKIYQICHVFRNGEDSNQHIPEFTMLEWYRSGADYHITMDDCVDLLKTCMDALNLHTFEYKAHRIDPFQDWQRITVCEAFQLYAGLDLRAHLNDRESFAKVARNMGIRVSAHDTWDNVFFHIMEWKIEPHLGNEVPCLLYDYPASMAALAKKKKSDGDFAERFELYIAGVEIANGFSELTDAQEQRQRFIDDMALKKTLYGDDIPIDENFLRALEYGLPDCSGVALGVDRIVMLLSNTQDIQDTLWCPVTEL